MAINVYNATLDDTYKLTDAITANVASTSVNGTVGGVARVIDFGEHATAYDGIDGAWSGSPPVPGTPTSKPYSRFAVVVDWAALNVNDGDEQYYIEIDGSNTTDFSTKHRLAAYVVGDTSNTGNAVDTPPNSRKVFFADNVVHPSASDGGAQVAVRYARIRVTPFGTTPSIAITGAWMVPF